MMIRKFSRKDLNLFMGGKECLQWDTIEDILDDEELEYGMCAKVIIDNFTTLPDYLIDVNNYVQKRKDVCRFQGFEIIIKYKKSSLIPENIKSLINYNFVLTKSHNSILKRIELMTGLKLDRIITVDSRISIDVK